MIAYLIAALIGNYMTTTFVIGLVVALVQILRHRDRSGSVVSGRFLNAYLFWAIGIGQSINFIMHSVFGDYAAKTIGWAQSPFQLELALSSLGFGVMAIILHGKRTQLQSKIAIVIAQLIFGLGAAGGHVFQMVVHHDYATNNGGLLLAMDVIIPLVGLAFVLWHAAARRHRVDLTDATVSRPEALATADR